MVILTHDEILAFFYELLKVNAIEPRDIKEMFATLFDIDVSSYANGSYKVDTELQFKTVKVLD